MSSPLAALGEFAAALRWESLPDAVRQRAALALRDTVATMTAGQHTRAARIAAGVATRQATPAMRAMAAAVAASALDFDDGHYRGGAIHPSSVIVPAVLVAAAPGTSRRQITVAQVAATEIALRAAHLLWPRHELDDYHCTGTAATLGAAAGVTMLHGGDADAVARSIAIAWAHAPMATFQLPMVKESIGWSAATAVTAAELAVAGFMALPPGDPSPLDATFPPTPFDRPGALDDPFVAGLGTRFEILDTYFKPYACCRYTHTALRSLRGIVDAHGLRADDVDAIEVHTPRPSMHLSEQRPRSLEHAQYSFPFVLATMLCTGDAGWPELGEDTLGDPERLAVAARVTVHHDPGLDPTYPAHYATRVVVHAGARRFEELRLVAPGDAADPLGPDQLAAKFERLAAGSALAGSAAELVADVDAPLPLVLNELTG